MNNANTTESSQTDLALLTVIEAARLLRISRNLAYELVASTRSRRCAWGA